MICIFIHVEFLEKLIGDLRKRNVMLTAVEYTHNRGRLRTLGVEGVQAPPEFKKCTKILRWYKFVCEIGQ